MVMRLPDSWDKITVGQFLNVRGVLKMREIDNIDRNVQLLSVLSGESVEEVEKLTVLQISQAIDKMEFLDKMPEPKAAKWFTLKGKIFKVYVNPYDMTAGQFADLTLFTKEKESTLENMHNILAVICLPMFRKYDGKTHQQRAKFFMDHMPVSFAYSLSVFFCQLLKISVAVTESYLWDQANLELTRASNLILKSTSKSGGGLSLSTN